MSDDDRTDESEPEAPLPEADARRGRWILRSPDRSGMHVRTVPLTTVLQLGALALSAIAGMASWNAGQRALAAEITAEIDRKLEKYETQNGQVHGALWEAMRSTSGRLDSHLDAHDRRGR